MARFFPRDVIPWGDETLHPLRAFAVRTLEPAGITGVVLRIWRALVLSSAHWLVFVAGVTIGGLFLCGMLTWHLGNYPVRRWPPRALGFLVAELMAELGMSSVLIAVRRERFGSIPARWPDWWPMAAQTIWQRTAVVLVFTLLLAVIVQTVRRRIDQRAQPSAAA